MKLQTRPSFSYLWGAYQAFDLTDTVASYYADGRARMYQKRGNRIRQASEWSSRIPPFFSPKMMTGRRDAGTNGGTRPSSLIRVFFFGS